MVNLMIVDAGQRLASLIRAQDFGDDFFTTNDVVACDDTQGYIDTQTLTDTFVRLKKVAWLRASGETPVPLDKASIDETYTGGITTATWGASELPKYRLVRNRILFYPAPAAAVTVIVTYDTDIGLASDLSNSVVLYPGWREWIVLDACRQISQREKDMALAAQWAAERDEVWNVVIKGNSPRDDWQPEQVRDLLDETFYPTIDWSRRGV